MHEDPQFDARKNDPKIREGGISPKIGDEPHSFFTLEWVSPSSCLSGDEWISNVLYTCKGNVGIGYSIRSQGPIIDDGNCRYQTSP